jgi:hypothetical protein
MLPLRQDGAPARRAIPIVLPERAKVLRGAAQQTRQFLFRKSLIPFLCGHPQIYRHLDAPISTISPSCEGGRVMDVVYLVLVVAFWLLLVGMAEGCASLGGPAK